MIVNQPGRGSQSHGHTRVVSDTIWKTVVTGEIRLISCIRSKESTSMFRLQIPELEERSQSSRRGARTRRSAQIGWELEGLEQRELLTAVSPVTAAHVFTQNPNATRLVPVSSVGFGRPTVAHPQHARTKPHPLGPLSLHPQHAGTKPHPLGPLSLHTPQGSHGSTINLNNLANPKLLTPLTGAHALTFPGGATGAFPTFQPPQATPGVLDFGELGLGQ